MSRLPFIFMAILTGMVIFASSTGCRSNGSNASLGEQNFDESDDELKNRSEQGSQDDFGYSEMGEDVEQGEHGEHGEKPGHGANAHMHAQPFDSLVARFEDPKRNDWQKPSEVIASLGPLNKLTVADLGAGTGYFSFPLSKEASKVIALDIDDRFLDYIKKNKPRRSKVEIRKTAASEINLKKGEADLVITVNTWHHIEDRVEYATDLLAKLPEDGRFVIVDFFKKELPIGPSPMLKVTHKRVRRELFEAGFETTSMDTSTLPYQYIITGYK